MSTCSILLEDKNIVYLTHIFLQLFAERGVYLQRHHTSDGKSIRTAVLAALLHIEKGLNIK
jgi:hypothetical protein